MTNEEIIKEIEKLKSDFSSLNEEFYRNNFTANQDFVKYSNFTSRLKVPHYDTLPAACEVGEICESAGKLRICSAANTWSVVGTQS